MLHDADRSCLFAGGPLVRSIHPDVHGGSGAVRRVIVLTSSVAFVKGFAV
ncbi:hypothetical protein [Nocardia nova]|nr:hypothetical protein [Nocardia nova]